MNDVKMGLSVIGVIIFLSFCFVSGIQCVRLLVNPQIKVLINKEIVFIGNNACVDVASLGANTALTINSGFLCLFPKASYAEKSIQIFPVNK